MDFFFKSLWNCYITAFVSCFGFLAARYVGSLAPRPGMEPALPVLKGSLKHWTTREVLSSGFF